jgi:hypothetical protein
VSHERQQLVAQDKAGDRGRGPASPSPAAPTSATSRSPPQPTRYAGAYLPRRHRPNPAAERLLAALRTHALAAPLDAGSQLCRPRGLIVWEQHPGILNEHHAVAEQAPSLLGMSDRYARGRTIRCQCIWAPGLVLAHIVLRSSSGPRNGTLISSTGT